MGRPRLYTDDERREKRRLKFEKWRANNLEKARQITRDCEKRRNDAKAIAAGRVPGQIGRPKPKPISDEERRAKQNRRIKRWYAQNKKRAQAIGATAARIDALG